MTTSLERPPTHPAKKIVVDIFNYPADLPTPEKFKYTRSDLTSLSQRAREIRLSPPELRSYLGTLDSFNRSRNPDNGIATTPIDEIELEAKIAPWEYSITILARKIHNTSRNSLNRALTVDQRIRTGAAAIEAALDTYIPDPEADSIVSFAQHIHGAITSAWERTRRAKIMGIVDPVSQQKKPDIPSKNGTLPELAPIPEDKPNELENSTASTDEKDWTADARSLFWKELNRPLLTAEQEVDLAKKMEAGKEAKNELLKNATALSEERQAELKAIAETGEAAIQTLIESNLKLVVRVARKYENRGVPLMDLISEGCIGLKRGVEKYDYKKGFRVSTYVYWWIRQSVTRNIAAEAHTIRLPIHYGEFITAMVRVYGELAQTLQREPSSKDVAEAMNSTPEEIEKAWKRMGEPTSLETPLGDGNVMLSNYVRDHEATDPQQKNVERSLRDDLEAAFDRAGLSPRERDALVLRNDEMQRTLQETGKEMGVSRERVRQLQAEAMRKLKETPEALELLAVHLSFD